MEVLVAYTKHGIRIYDGALACLNVRVGDGYWYDDEDKACAEDIVQRCSEDDARKFLVYRSDHEYEEVAWETVQG